MLVAFVFRTPSLFRLRDIVNNTNPAPRRRPDGGSGAVVVGTGSVTVMLRFSDTFHSGPVGVPFFVTQGPPGTNTQ